MAVRFDASSTDGLERSANLPSATSFTICVWAIRESTTAWQQLVGLYDNSGHYDSILVNADGSTIETFGGAGTNARFTRVPSVGEAFFVALTGDASNVNGYLRRIGESTLETQSEANNASLTSPTNIVVGNSPNFDLTMPFCGVLWNAKAWDRVLTPAEILIESYYFRPKFPSSINFWWPLANQNDLKDYSGNGRHPTVNGTPTTADGAHGLWQAKRRIIRAPAAGGTVYNESVAEAASASDARTGLLQAIGALSESASSSDADAGTINTSAALSESASSSDALIGGLNLSNSLSESASASDASSNALSVVGSLGEAASSSDALTHTAIVGNGLTEAGTAQDSGVNTAILVAGANEAVSASDALVDILGNQTYNETLAESAAATDSVTADPAPSSALGGPKLRFVHVPALREEARIVLRAAERIEEQEPSIAPKIKAQKRAIARALERKSDDAETRVRLSQAIQVLEDAIVDALSALLNRINKRRAKR